MSAPTKYETTTTTTTTTSSTVPETTTTTTTPEDRPGLLAVSRADCGRIDVIADHFPLDPATALYVNVRFNPADNYTLLASLSFRDAFSRSYPNPRPGTSYEWFVYAIAPSGSQITHFDRGQVICEAPETTTTTTVAVEGSQVQAFTHQLPATGSPIGGGLAVAVGCCLIGAAIKRLARRPA